MPPRKRAETKPEDPEASAQDSMPDSDSQSTTTPEDVPAPTSEAGPEKSNLQQVEAPCPECFPNGWPELAFSVGCEHGTWIKQP